ncbi:hypothetical protein [Actinomadura rubrobrunea]|uniref:hypothetical protein n=1 Tax=Actinomadura rubrobrunea TaxID=115335 RepID=UPI001470BD2A|nr:hypothetical protein [Actinomadura rubrobrunea]
MINLTSGAVSLTMGPSENGKRSHMASDDRAAVDAFSPGPEDFHSSIVGEGPANTASRLLVHVQVRMQPHRVAGIRADSGRMVIPSAWGDEWPLRHRARRRDDGAGAGFQPS